ncbi:YgaP family membrane protein [Citreimonas salinaria]|uniref:Inner membrane protein YgaP-like transmembrane domain-containing protein n=1 Tax=Citreimonas salinaria TaxID=321339 RepID=A0A1H3IJ11_9RHOB|nr:DUF2892 domain-containing protein [Citreimonas salinaria]SDY27365.1 Protein of unknown function [Citreimonas salinaria]
MIERNLGDSERMVRATVGIAGVVLFFFLTGWLQWAALVVGVVLLVTAAIGWCPPYALLGINTNRRRS